MTMEFNNNKSIFLQIADSLCEKISNGIYPPGEKIPSVRELAAEMGVNPNTIMRTFNELQTLHIIENKRGVGLFVAADAKERILAWKKEEFFTTALPEFLKQMAILGITYNDLRAHIEPTENK